MGGSFYGKFGAAFCSSVASDSYDKSLVQLRKTIRKKIEEEKEKAEAATLESAHTFLLCIARSKSEGRYNLQFPTDVVNRIVRNVIGEELMEKTLRKLKEKKEAEAKARAEKEIAARRAERAAAKSAKKLKAKKMKDDEESDSDDESSYSSSMEEEEDEENWDFHFSGFEGEYDEDQLEMELEESPGSIIRAFRSLCEVVFGVEGRQLLLIVLDAWESRPTVFIAQKNSYVMLSIPFGICNVPLRWIGGAEAQLVHSQMKKICEILQLELNEDEPSNRFIQQIQYS